MLYLTRLNIGFISIWIIIEVDGCRSANQTIRCETILLLCLIACRMKRW
jgi:hypothetical protein